MLTAGNCCYKLSGLTKTGGAIDDMVHLAGYSGRTNQKNVIRPLDYVLKTFGTWAGAP